MCGIVACIQVTAVAAFGQEQNAAAKEEHLHAKPSSMTI